MGIGRTYKGALRQDDTAMTVDAADHSGGLDNVRRAQRDLIAIAQREQLLTEQRETNRLLRALLEQRPQEG